MCVNDTVVAQYAATGGIGALVIAGTGSIAYGRNSSGEEAQQGGWPPVIFGDEGSGTWIARKALAFLSEVYDGRRRECVLSREVEHKLGIKSGKELISICIEIENKRWADPGLAFVVDSAASLGNEDAVAIIKEASEKTSTLAIGVIEKLKLYNEKPFLVGTWGSALVKSPLYLEYFTRTLTEKYPDAQVVVSEKDAAEGACAIALAHLALDR
jgi:N-acetylglucosamine kinase-like BadF-type ATPase